MRGSFAPPPHGALVLSLWQGCRGEEHSTVRGIDFVGTWAMKERWGTRSNISSSDSDSNSNSRTTKPKSTMEQSLSSSSVAPPSDEWRRFGEARRRELVEKDELAGGTSFHLNKNCRIQRYFLLADRVSLFVRERERLRMHPVYDVHLPESNALALLGFLAHVFHFFLLFNRFSFSFAK